MTLRVNKLDFYLPHGLLDSHIKEIDTATDLVRQQIDRSGLTSDRFKRHYDLLVESVQSGNALADSLSVPIDLRALAHLLGSEHVAHLSLGPDALQRINEIKPRPSLLFIEAMYAFFLREFDRIQHFSAVAEWLKAAFSVRDRLDRTLTNVLSKTGPQWLAEEAAKKNVDLVTQIHNAELDTYQSGRFLTLAQNYYYLKILRRLSRDQEHPVLAEVQKSSVYETQYDDRLLGHEVLTIMVSKASVESVSDAWLKVILSIGGDPRVSNGHRNYTKWWSQVAPELRQKVFGWLSKLDLRLFLEALENFSSLPGNSELKRMYPARKRFIEGLLNKKLVTGTRLYLTSGAAYYLQRNYKREHLPDYSTVSGQDKSLIYIRLDGADLVEGSHSCKLWIYDKLDSSAVVFDYGRKQVSYSSLTQELADSMRMKGVKLLDSITHHPPLGWQHKAISALRKLGVTIAPKDVLTSGDYEDYKKVYGA